MPDKAEAVLQQFRRGRGWRVREQSGLRLRYVLQENESTQRKSLTTHTPRAYLHRQLGQGLNLPSGQQLGGRLAYPRGEREGKDRRGVRVDRYDVIRQISPSSLVEPHHKCTLAVSPRPGKHRGGVVVCHAPGMEPDQVGTRLDKLAHNTTPDMRIEIVTVNALGGTHAVDEEPV